MAFEHITEAVNEMKQAGTFRSLVPLESAQANEVTIGGKSDRKSVV